MAFKGHTDYLHSVVVREANRQVILLSWNSIWYRCCLHFMPSVIKCLVLFSLQVVTGSEDGTARIWGEQWFPFFFFYWFMCSLVSFINPDYIMNMSQFRWQHNVMKWMNNLYWKLSIHTYTTTTKPFSPNQVGGMLELKSTRAEKQRKKQRWKRRGKRTIKNQKEKGRKCNKTETQQQQQQPSILVSRKLG
jgi:hypothetical protein